MVVLRYASFIQLGSRQHTRHIACRFTLQSPFCNLSIKVPPHHLAPRYARKQLRDGIRIGREKQMNVCRGKRPDAEHLFPRIVRSLTYSVTERRRSVTALRMMEGVGANLPLRQGRRLHSLSSGLVLHRALSRHQGRHGPLRPVQVHEGLHAVQESAAFCKYWVVVFVESTQG